MIKLSKLEMRRLEQIADNYWRTFGYMRATNEKLAAKGLIVEVGRKTAKTGRVVWYGTAHLTELGDEIIASFPKKETSSRA